MDEKIKTYAKQQKIKLSESYERMIEENIREGKNITPLKPYYIPKTAAAAIIFCIVAAGGYGVYAAVNHAQERMAQMPDVEKEIYVQELQNSSAGADTFSRKLTAEENERLEILQKEYQQKGIFPEYSITEIASANEINPQKICFEAKSSTFYLPESVLSDEELLELIDFYNKRDYSLMALTQPQPQQELEEISGNEAEEKAMEVTADVFSADTSSMKIVKEYNQCFDENKGHSSYYVTLSAGDISYVATVDLQTGKVSALSSEHNTSNYASGISADMKEYQSVYPEAKDKAGAFLDRKDSFAESYLEIVTDQDHVLDKGIVNYCFVMESGDACIVSYSCIQKQIYQLRYFDKSAFEERNSGRQADCEKNNLIFQMIEIE